MKNFYYFADTLNQLVEISFNYDSHKDNQDKSLTLEESVLKGLNSSRQDVLKQKFTDIIQCNKEINTETLNLANSILNSQSDIDNNRNTLSNMSFTALITSASFFLILFLVGIFLLYSYLKYKKIYNNNIDIINKQKTKGNTFISKKSGVMLFNIIFFLLLFVIFVLYFCASLMSYRNDKSDGKDSENLSSIINSANQVRKGVVEKMLLNNIYHNDFVKAYNFSMVSSYLLFADNLSIESGGNFMDPNLFTERVIKAGQNYSYLLDIHSNLIENANKKINKYDNLLQLINKIKPFLQNVPLVWFYGGTGMQSSGTLVLKSYELLALFCDSYQDFQNGTLSLIKILNQIKNINNV